MTKMEISETINTSRYSKQEAAKILKDRLSETAILILVGPQGGGKTTIAIESLDENTGAIFEGRVRTAQPVIMIRKDAVKKLKNLVVEHRPLPIYEGDQQLYTEITAYDTIRTTIENIFDILELGEIELSNKISSIAKEHGIDTGIIELIAEPDELRIRRKYRKDDAKARLSTLIDKEKKYHIDSNILSIQGAKILDIIHRERVGAFSDGEISRTIDDFDKTIQTDGKTIAECLKILIQASKQEKGDAGFLVLHKHKHERIISDIVIAGEHSTIGVTLLEVYVGFRQKGGILGIQEVYKPDIVGVVEVIHSHHGDGELLSTEDRGAAGRFGIIVTVIGTNGGIDSTHYPRKKTLQGIMYEEQKAKR